MWFTITNMTNKEQIVEYRVEDLIQINFILLTLQTFLFLLPESVYYLLKVYLFLKNEFFKNQKQRLIYV